MPAPPLRIHYAGLLRSPASWARVGRELALALARGGHHVTVTSNRGFLYEGRFPLHPELRELIGPAPEGCIHLTFEYPPNYPRLRGRPRVGLLTWESTRLPASWAASAEKHLDLLVVPSGFVRDAATAAGVSPDKIAVVPYGYDPQRFGPHRLKTDADRPFTFLTVATPHRRKGVREVIQAFGQAFTTDDPVKLLVKTSYVPGQYGRIRPWEETEWPSCVPTVELRVGSVDDDALAQVYGEADCGLQPSWGEGFGLSILEGMACGLPMITTGWGGQTAFASAQDAYLIDSDLVPGGPLQYDADQGGGQMARPRVEHLARLLREVLDAPEAARSRGAAGREAVKHLTWEYAAGQLADVLRERFGP